MAEAERQPSIISHMLSMRTRSEFDYPWDAPCPAELESQVRHARFLSILVGGATLHYFHLLSLERVKQKSAQENRCIQRLVCEVVGRDT